MEFVQNFELSTAEYEDLAVLLDHFADPQIAACTWIKSYRERRQVWPS